MDMLFFGADLTKLYDHLLSRQGRSFFQEYQEKYQRNFVLHSAFGDPLHDSTYFLRQSFGPIIRARQISRKLFTPVKNSRIMITHRYRPLRVNLSRPLS